jgi:hypothetical protein
VSLIIHLAECEPEGKGWQRTTLRGVSDRETELCPGTQYMTGELYPDEEVWLEEAADVPAPIDSRPATLLHSLRVADLMVGMLQEGMRRAVQHDLSKTEPPEVELFDRMIPRLSALALGSPEYAAALAELKPALHHHYRKNRHHPEFGDGTVNWMTLVDLMEMIADWKAATEREGGTGDLRRSVTLNMQRFGIGEQLAGILLNTAEHFGWIEQDSGERT